MAKVVRTYDDYVCAGMYGSQQETLSVSYLLSVIGDKMNAEDEAALLADMRAAGSRFKYDN
eukprot:scaffold4780_cov113-Cylindrotheca_fusiformis.AAC.5